MRALGGARAGRVPAARAGRERPQGLGGSEKQEDGDDEEAGAP